MLSLTRKQGQTIKIGPLVDGRNIIIHIGAVRSGHVQVNIDAPRSVKILRGELEDREEREEIVDRETKCQETPFQGERDENRTRIV